MTEPAERKTESDTPSLLRVLLHHVQADGALSRRDIAVGLQSAKDRIESLERELAEATRELGVAKMALADEGYELDLIPLAAKCVIAEHRAEQSEHSAAELIERCAKVADEWGSYRTAAAIRALAQPQQQDSKRKE